MTFPTQALHNLERPELVSAWLKFSGTIMNSKNVILAIGLVFLACLSGCGGSSSSSPHTQTVTITTSTLPNATVGTAYSQTLSENGGVAPFTWSISDNSLPAGFNLDSNTGKISGTPTGPSGTASFSVTVSDAESPAAKGTTNLSIVVNGSATGLLKGNYAFLFSGYFNGYFAAIGSFVADGAGNITNGMVDTNGPGGPTSTGTFTGTYSIDSNKLGTMHLAYSGSGAGTYSIALSSNGSARWIQYDTRGVEGAGVIKKQDTSAFSAAKVTGTYAYGLVGINGPNANRMALAGELQSDGVSSLSSGLADINDNGVVSSSASVTGTYSVASTGRGTAALNVGGLGTLNTTFYVVSPSELFLMETDTVGASHPLLSGDILQQVGAGSFSNASFSGASVIEADGASSMPAASSVSLGFATASPTGTLSLNLDINSGGNLSTSSQQLTYSVAPDGRVSTTGTNPPVLYLVNQNQAFVLFPDNAVTFGTLEPQAAGPFTNASLSGNSEGGTVTLGAAGSAETDVLSADGNGNLTQTFNNSDGTHLQQGVKSLTYTVASNGRVSVITSKNATAEILYIISPTRVAVIGGSNPSLGIFEH